MVDLTEIGVILQTISVMSAATAAVIGVRSYINTNKRAEDAKKKEQETRDLELKAQQQNLETRQAQLFMGIYQQMMESRFINSEKIIWTKLPTDYDAYLEVNHDSEFTRPFS